MTGPAPRREPAASVVPGQLPEVLVSVTEIRRRPGSRTDVHRELVADGLGITGVSVPDGSLLVFDGELESINEGVVLTGRAAIPWVGLCRRCLEDVAGVAEIEVREIYETKPVDGETWPLLKDHVDLGPLLRDIALLALPLAPLCSEDCSGPAPDALPVRLEGQGAEPAGPGSDGPHQPKDPRWAALDQLRLDP